MGRGRAGVPLLEALAVAQKVVVGGGYHLRPLPPGLLKLLLDPPDSSPGT